MARSRIGLGVTRLAAETAALVAETLLRNGHTVEVNCVTTPPV